MLGLPWLLYLLVDGSTADLVELRRSAWGPFAFALLYPAVLDRIARLKGERAGLLFGTLLLLSAIRPLSEAVRVRAVESAWAAAIYVGGALGLFAGAFVVILLRRRFAARSLPGCE